MKARKPSGQLLRSVELANQSRHAHLKTASLRALFESLDTLPFPHKAPPGTLSIAVVDDAAIATVHGQFFADPTPTDVITFPGDGTADNAGEIIISAERALAVAARRHLPPLREIALYLVHGWLHLAGYDDRSAATRRTMRSMERKAFELLPEARWQNIGRLTTAVPVRDIPLATIKGWLAEDEADGAALKKRK